MKMARMIAPLLTLALSEAAAGVASPVEISHEPLSCVPRDRYARFSARGVPADDVARAELQFRTGPDAAWYATSMTAAAGEWSALLPRTTSSLSVFEYRIAMTTRTLETAVTPPFGVRVAEASDACAATAQDALDLPIMVRVPPGAPMVPPVPAGFSPAGVVAAQLQVASGSKKPLVLIGSGGALGVAAALASSLGGSLDPAAVDIPSFTFSGTLPNPGTVLSLGHGSLAVLVTMSHEPSRALDFDWRLELRADPEGPVCLVMENVFNDARWPLSLVLTAPLAATGACGERFEVAFARLTIDVAGTRALDSTRRLAFVIEP
jgi:hypothetical protein